MEMQKLRLHQCPVVAKTRALTLCYELAADFADLHNSHGTGDIP
jgi:hypothetical protein